MERMANFSELKTLEIMSKAKQQYEDMKSLEQETKKVIELREAA
jgi:hypothetical protein